MDDKYNISKSRKPETKSEEIEQRIQELIKKRDAETNPAAKAKLQAEIMTLFAQFERLKL